MTGIVLVNLFYLPSLWFGFRTDDFHLVILSFSDIPGEMLDRAGFRSGQLLFHALPNFASQAAWFQHFFSLALLNACMIPMVPLCRSVGWSPAWILPLAFLHPSFIWPVTWIAQRQDLVLIAFFLAALWQLERNGGGLTALVCSNLSKSPFVFANLPLAVLWLRRGRYFSSAVAVLLPVALLVAGAAVTFPHMGSASQLFVLAERKYGALLVLAAALAKVAEGIALVFVPFPAFWGSPLFWISVAGFAAIWVAIAIRGARERREWRTALHYGVIFVLMSAPFAISSELRIVSPAVPFLCLGVAALLRPGRLNAALLGALIALHAFGSLRVYELSNTGCFDLGYDRPNQCDRKDLPAYVWLLERAQMRERLLKDPTRG